jgi:hypothetical protein
MADAIDHRDDVQRRRKAVRVSMCAVAAMLLTAGLAAAQAPAEAPKPPDEAAPAAPVATPPTTIPPTTAPPTAENPAPADSALATSAPANSAPANPAPENPGIVGAFGTWMQQGVTSMSSGFDAMAKGAADAASTMAKGAADVATGAASVAKDAAGVAVDGVTKLPVSGFASGHEQCTLAANGAPDCRAAAENLCRARGFATGTSVDYVTAEKCSPAYRLSSRERPEGICPMEHFVTRAMCR